MVFEAYRFSPKVVDLTGKRFYRWRVLGFAERRKGRLLWLCECDCQNTGTIDGSSLKQGFSKSCGCLKKEQSAITLAKQSFRHGHARDGKESREYRSWHAMLTRCLNKNSDGYKHYGAKGIKVCARWNPKRGGSFQNFLADMGPRPKNTSLDRYPKHKGNYKPSNCRWGSPADQSRNQARTKLSLEKAEQIRRLCKQKGLSRPVVAKRFGVSETTVADIVTGKLWRNA